MRRATGAAIAFCLMLTTAVVSAQNKPFPVLYGPYLGMPPPGLEAQIFAPQALAAPGLNHHTLSFSPDGRELYFSRYPDRVTLVMRMDANGLWLQPEPAPFNGWEAVFMPDGITLIFGDGDLWKTVRTRNGWSMPVKLAGEVNTYNNDFYASAEKDGRLYFTRLVNRKQIVYSAEYRNGAYVNVKELPALVNGEDAYHPFVSPDGTYLIFNSSKIPGTYGKSDLYVTFRNSDGSWGRPVNLGPGVNSGEADICPVVSPDGRYLFFTRLGYDAGGNWTGTPYWVDMRVIEKAREREQ